MGRKACCGSKPRCRKCPLREKSGKQGKNAEAQNSQRRFVIVPVR